MDIRFKTVRGLAKLPLKPRFQLHSCLQYLHPFQYFHDRWHQRALFFTFPGLCPWSRDFAAPLPETGEQFSALDFVCGHRLAMVCWGKP